MFESQISPLCYELEHTGTGKNKIADRLLQLLQREREYIQLHRDSTLQSLTLSPSLENGQIVWKDSPLVKSVIHGRTLIVDEADKAPLEVICVLKALCEDGELQLADGRRLVDPKRYDVSLDSNAVPISEDFQMFVLANRPGFPFHGNNLYSVCGDVFAPVAVDNPDRASELELCSKYVVFENVTFSCSNYVTLKLEEYYSHHQSKIKRSNTGTDRPLSRTFSQILSILLLS